MAATVSLAVVLAVATLVLSVLVLPAGSGGGPAIASGAVPAATPGWYVARPGDTLWSIAEEHHGDIDVRRYLDALIDLNGGTRIAAGQAVHLP